MTKYVVHLTQPRFRFNKRGFPAEMMIESHAIQTLDTGPFLQIHHDETRKPGSQSLSDSMRFDKHFSLTDPADLLERFTGLVIKHGKKSRVRLLIDDMLMCLNELAKRSYHVKTSGLPTFFSGNTRHDGQYSRIFSEPVMHVEREQRIAYAGPTHNAPSSLRSSQFFLQALNHIRPHLEVRRVRIAGRTYQVPAAVPPARSANMAMRWLIAAAQKRTRNERNTWLYLHKSLIRSSSTQAQTEFGLQYKAITSKQVNLGPPSEALNASQSEHKQQDVFGVFSEIESNIRVRSLFAKCLALELWDALHFQGQARQQRHELHQLALSNRAFYHYRWWLK